MQPGRTSSHAILEQWQPYPNIPGPETLKYTGMWMASQVAWVIKPSHFSRSMAKSDNTPGPGSYFAGSGQVGEAYSEITRFGGEMLTKASKTWAHRNPGTSMAIRFDPLDAF